MLTVYECVQLSLIEEGQYLLGMDFITNALGMTWDNLEEIFVKSVMEYGRRRPICEDKVFTFSGENLTMPVGTQAVRAVRFPYLTQFPRFMFPDFGVTNFEYHNHTRVLKVFPPFSSLRVTYLRDYILEEDAMMTFFEDTAKYEDKLTFTLPIQPRKGTIRIVRANKEMVEVGKTMETVKKPDGSRTKEEFIKLEGSLGVALYNPRTQEIVMTFDEGLTSKVVITCNSRYRACPELDKGDFIFMMFFKAYLLEAVASLRAQGTQENLHNIDLTADDLYSRVRMLKNKIDIKLKRTIDLGALAPI